MHAGGWMCYQVSLLPPTLPYVGLRSFLPPPWCSQAAQASLASEAWSGTGNSFALWLEWVGS